MTEILVNGRFRGRPVSGVARYASEVLRGCNGQVTVLAPRRPLRGLAGHVWEQIALPRLARQAPSPTWQGLLWSPANTGPLAVSRQVLTIHDLSPLDHPEWFAPAFALWYQMLLPPLARRVRRVLTPSTFSRGRVIQRLGLPEEKVLAVPGGVEPAHFHPTEPAAVRARYGLAGPYLLFVGTLEPRKNLSTLLSAWEILCPANPALELVIAGGRSPVFRSALPAKDQTRPTRVRFLGTVPDLDLPGLYSGAVALVLPSLYEGFGLPVLEAMACGTPAISSRAGALAETAGEAAILVDPADSQGLSRAIEQILRDEGLRAELQRRGFERAASFPWSQTAGRMWKIFQDEAESHG